MQKYSNLRCLYGSLNIKVIINVSYKAQSVLYYKPTINFDIDFIDQTVFYSVNSFITEYFQQFRMLRVQDMKQITHNCKGIIKQRASKISCMNRLS